MAMPTQEHAQDIHTTKDLEALKQEVVHRAEINLYPVFGMPPEVIRNVMSDVQTLRINEWANAFIKAGNTFLDKAKCAETTDANAALGNYNMAQRLYFMGRWPAVLSKQREESYLLEIEAFEAVQRLKGADFERIEIKYNAQPVVGYLFKPKPNTSGAFPLVIAIGGVDGWKEFKVTQFAPLVEQGVAILALDMPGTGQSGVKMGQDAEASLFAIIDTVLARTDIDSSNVVLYGGSFGGYWATLLSARNRVPLVGMVNQSGPYARTFDDEQMIGVFGGNVYLYDCFPALANLFDGITGREDFLDAIQRHALDKVLGASVRINAPILVVGGKHDSLVPQEDLVSVLFSNGALREAWINPNGIHMGWERGSNAQWDDRRIMSEIVFPWILERMSTQ